MTCTMARKWLLVVFTFWYASMHVVAQEQSTAAPAVKTFALQSDVTGAAANSVNQFTGDVAFPLNLVSLPGHNGLDVSVSINYNGNVQEQATTWTRESPTGIIGMGWSMDVPKIIADYKETGAKEDDDYYLLLKGGSNKLIRTTSGYDNEVASYYYEYATRSVQFWRIRYYYDNLEVRGPGFSGGPNKWVITTEEGTRYIYGDQNSGRNTVQYAVRWSNWMGNSAQISNQSRLAIEWDLSEVINVWNEKITYAYEQVEQYVGSTAGLKHTEASYLSQITDVYGRKAQFYYNEKAPYQYTEPHTERAEPDAYQERYEKKYLDHIDVLQEDGNKLLSVQLAYTTLNGQAVAKMVLSDIVQKNAAGKALPGMHFGYSTDEGPTFGYMTGILYPNGGNIVYQYSTGLSINRANRARQIVAPAGYAEAKTYVGEDYVAVIWRQLGSNGAHADESKTLLLYMYSWAGEWKEQLMGGLGFAELTNLEDDGVDPAFKDYKDFQVTVQKDFFAVLTHNSNNNGSNLTIVSRSQGGRGEWNSFIHWGTDYGGGIPTLLSGDNFVAVGPTEEDGNHPGKLFTNTGDTWVQKPLQLATGYYDYTASNNYFICQKRTFPFAIQPMAIYFNYLTEDRKWVTKTLDNSVVFEYPSDGRTLWSSSNSMAVAMANNNPEYAYRWDVTYNTFFRDDHDVNNNQLFGELNDVAPVFIMNNSLVGIKGRIARYDGWNWYTNNITSAAQSIPEGLFSYGDDYIVRPVSEVFGAGTYRGGRMVFDPNQLQWQPDVIMDGADIGDVFSRAGIDFYYFGNGFYYRNTDGTWQKKITFDVSNTTYIPYCGYPRFTVLCDRHPLPIWSVNEFRNGNTTVLPGLDYQKLFYNPSKFKTHGFGDQTIVSYSTAFNSHENATILQLTRVVNHAIVGNLLDYPVIRVGVNDGENNRYTSYQYKPETAVFDETGNTAQYNEVTMIPGSADVSSRPLGYTKTYFNNGLTSTELGIPFIPFHINWTGTPYETQVYDNTNTMLGSSVTDFTTFAKDILNDEGTLLYTAKYVRATRVTAMLDGVQKITDNQYNDNTGQIWQSTVYDHNSKGNQVTTNYKYFWEQYDPTRSTNILSPIIQTKKTITTPSSGDVVTGVTAVTWKNWNNVFGPHKTYQWKRTGSTTDFDFTNWSGSGEPAADWIKTSQVDVMDAAGNIIQVTNR